jgi:hypothetical protein
MNPYGAPQAPVGDYVARDHAVLERARSVPADHGVGWYREAWRLFKQSPGVWIGIWAVFTVIVIVVSMIPAIGGFIVGVATPLFVGGTMIAARNADRAGGARFADLFAAFGDRTGALLVIGLLQLAISFVAGILMALVAGVYAVGAMGFALGSSSFDQMMSADVIVPMMIFGVVIGLVFAPITNAVWLASGLVALEGAGAVDALRRAFGATLRNLLPLLVFVLVTIGLAAMASRLGVQAAFTKTIPLHHPYMSAFLQYRQDFSGANRILVAIKSDKGSIYYKHFMRTLRTVTDDVSAISACCR